jgi:hypothetical protein
VNSITGMATYGWTPLAWAPNGNASERIALLEGPTSSYFNSSTRTPRTAYGIRPSMMLAAKDIATAQALIDRSVAADGAGIATTNSYVVRTVDANRGIRGWIYPPSLIGAALGPHTMVTYKVGMNGLNDPSNIVANQDDVLYLATGMASIDVNAGNTWAPGGSADAPTSTSGYFVANLGSEVGTCFTQTCATWFITQGAYGTCGNTGAEPAALRKKWPVPDLWLQCMLAGESLGECYNKTIESPYQSNLVGDLMTQPYAFVGAAGLSRRSVRHLLRRRPPPGVDTGTRPITRGGSCSWKWRRGSNALTPSALRGSVERRDGLYALYLR